MFDAYINIFVIFSLMFIGYILSYKQWFSNRTADTFSKLVLNLTLPANMFLTIIKNFTKEEFLSLVSGMVIPLLSMLITYMIGHLWRRFFHVAHKHKGAFSSMFTFSNTIFIGLPINLAIFGEKAVPYVLLYYIVNTTLFWTIGIYELAKDSPHFEEAQVSFHPLVVIKKVFSPALIGFIIGLIWMLLAIPLPHFINSLGSYLADLTTPLSMFIIGIIVYFGGLKNLKMTKDIAGILFGRFILSPLIVFGLGYLIKIPELMLQVFVIQSSMPVQNSVPILVRNYQGDEEFATTALGYSVLLYMVYIPILLLLLF
ncbi:AEC family transporter [Enterococcus sp.]|uniref:AEC family transporter n=2 Tax=Enterococcus sp. TaxID=35783 RepID=UPI002898C092|nr:AEC family transporter [Enterococcus sp.]